MTEIPQPISGNLGSLLDQARAIASRAMIEGGELGGNEPIPRGHARGKFVNPDSLTYRLHVAAKGSIGRAAKTFKKLDPASALILGSVVLAGSIAFVETLINPNKPDQR